ncbi:MAG: hypothetical protein HFJ37_05555 [Clostridia bacterium]|nr:hypothetical protein [Clostridia bacterium]
MKESFIKESEKEKIVQENKHEEKAEFQKVKEKPKKVEKEIKKMEEEKNKKNYVFLGMSIGILVIAAMIISTIFALIHINNEKIISGVSISGIEVAGLSKEEAKGKIGALYDEKKEKEIEIKYQEYETSLNPTLMEVNYSIDKAVEEAYLTGRKGNIFLNNYDILFTLIGKKNINIDMSLNEELTKQTIDDIGVNLPGVVIESSYSIEEDELIITKGKAGIAIDTESLLEKVKERLKDVNHNEDFIEIPILNKQPEPINIDKIHEEIYKEAKDAYYTKEPFTVYPEVEGVDFDVEAARAILAEEKEEYIIKLTITKPKVTIEQIGSEAFPNQLSIFTTRFDVSDVDRSTNLRIACQKINGKVVLPGETFSYNQALGARTAAAGYKNGKIYAGGEVVDGIGGGICQISSTLYNSVLLANLDIVERRNHQFVTSYVGPGRDATVVYGMTDFKFKNTRKYPIKITATAKNGIATISIYGMKEENEYTFKFSTKTIGSIPFTTKYVEDANIPVGTEKVKQKGANGLKTETYITKMLNGKVISTKLLSRDTYDAMTRIVIKGVKAGTTQNTAPVETQEPSTQTPETQPPTEEQQPETPPTTNTETEGQNTQEIE